MSCRRLVLTFCTLFSVPGFAGDFSNSELCKAAIAMDMARPPSIMKTEETGDVPQISYNRDDGDHFLYKCKVRGSRVVWSAYFTETNSWGRWRDGEWDPVLNYRVENGALLITSSETGQTKTFTREDF